VIASSFLFSHFKSPFDAFGFVRSALVGAKSPVVKKQPWWMRMQTGLRPWRGGKGEACGEYFVFFTKTEM